MGFLHHRELVEKPRRKGIAGCHLHAKKTRSRGLFEKAVQSLRQTKSRKLTFPAWHASADDVIIENTQELKAVYVNLQVMTFIARRRSFTRLG